MKKECEAAVRAAAGARQLTKGDIDAIQSRLQMAAKSVRRADPQAWEAMTPGDRLKAAAELARSKHLEQITAGHSAALRRVELKLKADGVIDALPAGKQLDGILANTFLTHGQSTANPTENAVRGIRAWIGTRLTGADERLLSDPTKTDAFAMEATGADSGDAQVKALTKKWQAISDELLARLRRAGVPINDLENYRSPQPWDWTRIGSKEDFVRDMQGWVDPREFTNEDGSQQSPEQLRHTLEAAWLTLKTNGANKRAGLVSRGTRPSGDVGVRYRAMRQLHFKDGATWLAAMRKYGESDDFGGILRTHWHNLSRDVAVAETHGPMADTDFRERVARAETTDLAAAKTQKEARKIAAKSRRILEQWEVMQHGVSPGNANVAAFMGAIRGVLSASKLGVLVSQQPSDTLMSMNFLKLVGMDTAHFGRDLAAGLNAKGERANWLRAIGAWSDSLHDVTTRFGDTEIWNRTSKFLNRTVYVRSGMRALDRANTSAVAGSFYGTLGDHVASGKAFDALPQASRELLAKHGFDAESWDVLRKAGASKMPGDDRTVFNPNAIYDIPDDALRALAEKRVAGVGDELKARMRQLTEATEKEAGWTDKRQAKLDDLRQRTENLIRELEAKEAVRAGQAEGKAAARSEAAAATESERAAGARAAASARSERSAAVDSVREGHAEGVAAAKAEVLRAQVERAEVEADITRYLDARDHQNAMLRHLDAVEDGGERERTVVRQRTHPDNMSDSVVENFSANSGIDERMARDVERLVAKVGTNGEKIGELRARADAKIKAAEAKLKHQQELVEVKRKARDAAAQSALGHKEELAATKQAAKDTATQKALADKEAAASDKIDAKQAAADKRIAAQAKELADFTKEMQSRAARREDLLDAYRKEVGKAVADETARIRDEVMTNLLGTYDDVLHAAGRGYAQTSVSERARLGLTKFEPGTLMGEAARMFYLIRQVPFGMAMTHLWDVPRGMDGWAPRSKYVAKYMVGQAIATGVAVQLRHLLAGEDPEDMTSFRFIGQAVAGAGIGPLMAALLVGSGGEDNDPMGKIVGPGGDFLATALSLAQTVRDDAAKDTPVDWGKIGNRTLSLARSNAVPFMNFWYTKAAFNHLVYQQLQESVSPGYNDRREARMNQRGVHYWWRNGDIAPQRGPDMGNAIGQPTK